MPMNLNRREVATVIAGLHLLAGDAVRAPNYRRTLLATFAADAQTEYELNYEADEDYVRELIDRINEIVARGAQLCRRCTEKYPGKWQSKSGSIQCGDCGRTVRRYFVITKSAARFL